MTLEEFTRQFAEYQMASNLPPPSWNIKPTEQVAILVGDHRQPDVKRAESARWALTPPWSKTLETPVPLFNARSETVFEKPSFRSSALTRRCVIPATGYYEWSGPKHARVPHFIHLHDEVLLFAGMHAWWKDPSAPPGTGWHLTTTMLTMESYGPMESLHHRIPVFIDETLLSDWISPLVKGTAELFAAVTASSGSTGHRLREHTVAPLRGDGPEVLDPVSPFYYDQA